MHDGLADEHAVERIAVPCRQATRRTAPAGPPTVADAKIHNGDRRLLSFAIGAWRWRVEGVEP